MKPLVLFCPQMAQIAEKLRAFSCGSVEFGHVQWGHFENKWPSIYIENAENIKGCDVVLLASFDTPADAVEQLGLIYAMKFYGARMLNVWLPFYPPGTKERIVDYGDIATAKTLARMISATPRLANGEAAKFHIFDIHAEAEGFFFSDDVQYCPHTAIPIFVRELQKLANFENTNIAFPDIGAAKRFGHLLPQFTCPVLYHKERYGEDRKLVLVEGDPRGKDVWIVDDLATTGGTLLKCREKLVKSGAKSVSVFVTHGVFPQERWKRLCDNADFANIWITDSCPIPAQHIEGLKPFRVLSLVPELAHMTLSSCK